MILIHYLLRHTQTHILPIRTLVRDWLVTAASGSVMEFRRVQHLHEPGVSQNETKVRSSNAVVFFLNGVELEFIDFGEFRETDKLLKQESGSI